MPEKAPTGLRVRRPAGAAARRGNRVRGIRVHGNRVHGNRANRNLRHDPLTPCGRIGWAQNPAPEGRSAYIAEYGKPTPFAPKPAIRRPVAPCPDVGRPGARQPAGQHGVALQLAALQLAALQPEALQPEALQQNIWRPMARQQTTLPQARFQQGRWPRQAREPPAPRRSRARNRTVRIHPLRQPGPATAARAASRRAPAPAAAPRRARFLSPRPGTSRHLPGPALQTAAPIPAR